MSPVLAVCLMVSGANAQTLATLTNVVTVAVSEKKGLKVISSADVERVVAFEAEKQVMGCNEAESCLAEVAGAMGARWVVFGDVGRLGSRTLVTLSLFDSERGSAEERVIARASDLDVLVDELDAAARKLVSGLKEEKVVVLSLRSAGSVDDVEEEPTPEVVEGGGSPALLWTGIGVVVLGAAAGVTGIIIGNQAQVHEQAAEDERVQLLSDRLYEDAEAGAGIANLLFIAAGVAAVVGGGVAIFGVME